MYDVYIINGNVQTQIHGGGYGLPSAKIEDAKNAISTFNFTIYPNNAGYDLIEPFSTMIEVYNNNRGRYDFKGRVLQITPCMDSDGMIYKTVTCESRMAYLCDTIQPYAEEKQYQGDDTRNGLQEFIDVILANHNAQVGADKQIVRGNVTLTTYESSGGVYKGLNYESTWDIIKNKLVDVFGGEIQLRETNGVLYLDYAEELGETRATTIELGKNMESAQRAIDCTEIVTRLIPLGNKLKKQVTDADGNVSEEETEERLTVASVNDGLNFIEDSTAAALYGYIYKTVTWDDVTDANNLLSKGNAWLADNNTIKEKNNIVSLDLSILGIDVDDFVLYDKYPVRNDLIGLYATLEIVKKTTDVVEPYSSTFDMGEREYSMSDSVLDIGKMFKDVEATVKKSTNVAIDNVINKVYTIVNKSVESAITQSESDIELYVQNNTVSKSDYDTLYTTIKTALQLSDDGIAMVFQIINEAISDVDNASQSRYSEILKYIRFEDGNIVLGEVGNPLTLKIENDKIAFYQNGIAVAYFTNNKLYVTNGEFTETFKLGKFQASPRANGNVTWKVIE